MKLLPFNLEAAKAGAKLITRDGRSVRYLGEHEHLTYPVICVIRNINNECVDVYTPTGRSYAGDGESDNDLFIIKEPKRVPFDLEKAKAGATLVTRDGRPARLLGILDHPSTTDPMIIAVRDDKGESLFTFYLNGRWHGYEESSVDLFILE